MIIEQINDDLQNNYSDRDIEILARFHGLDKTDIKGIASANLEYKMMDDNDIEGTIASENMNSIVSSRMSQSIYKKEFSNGTGKIILFGIYHDYSLPDDDINYIINYIQEHPDTILLLEVDSRLCKKDILKTGADRIILYEPTTDRIIDNIIKSNNLNNIKIGGWDNRPSILGYRQSGLYGVDQRGIPHFPKHTMDVIYDSFILPAKNIKSWNVDKFLEIKKLYENKSDKLTLHELVLGGIVEVSYVDNLITELRDYFSNVSDEHIIDIISKNRDKDFIIIMGYKHFENLTKYFTNQN